MSTSDPAQARPTVTECPPSAPASSTGDDAGEGWVLFAAVMLAMLAVLNLLEGVAAVSNSPFFVADASDLDTWAWVLIGTGVVQLVTAFGISARWKAARWIGVAIAALDAIAQLAIMPAYPLWALYLFALAILVIYGLVVHGGRRFG